MGQLLQDLIDDYRLQERGSARMSEQRVRKHLIPAFGAVRAAQLSSTHIKAYKLRRKKDAANATVNRELELLQRALKLGYEREPPLVLRVPRIEMLPEQNVREGDLRAREPFEIARGHALSRVSTLLLAAGGGLPRGHP